MPSKTFRLLDDGVLHPEAAGIDFSHHYLEIVGLRSCSVHEGKRHWTRWY